LNYYHEGKKAQKDFKKLDIFNTFDSYIFSGILKDTFEHNAYDFIKGMLEKTKNRVLFDNAITVAEHYKDNTSLWSLILSTLNGIIKGVNKPPWVADFIFKLINYSSLKLANYNTHLLITMMLTYDNSYNTHMLISMKERPWFDELTPYLEKDIIDNLDKISSAGIIGALLTLKDVSFYHNILEITNIPEIFTKVISKFKFFNTELNGFIGTFDIIKILKTNKLKLLKNQDSMSLIGDMILQYYNKEVVSLWINLLLVCEFNEEQKIILLKKLETLEYEEVYNRLFDLTKEEKYLPKVAEDIFLF